MAVENPMHLSEGVRMTIHCADGSKVAGTLLHNDAAHGVLCLEIREGEFAQVAYKDFDRANVSLQPAMPSRKFVWIEFGNENTCTTSGNRTSKSTAAPDTSW